MVITKATSKGQVVIPAELRRKFKITGGTRLAIAAGEGDVILLRPVPDNPIEASRGMLKGKSSLTKTLLKERCDEAKRG